MFIHQDRITSLFEVKGQRMLSLLISRRMLEFDVITLLIHEIYSCLKDALEVF